VIIALVLGSGVIAKLALAGRWEPLLALCVGALFVPALALALGCWSNNSKLFEGAYLFIWYLASLSGVPYLDFMGRLPPAIGQGIPWAYAGLTILLVVAAVLGRRRQLKR